MSQSQTKRKNELKILFSLLCVASKGFMKALKAFMKPFESPQGSVKIKILINFYFNTTFEMHGIYKVKNIIHHSS